VDIWIFFVLYSFHSFLFFNFFCNKKTILLEIIELW
jgi:hypothetical protein